MENRKFIGDNKVAIANNTLKITLQISMLKAIHELKGSSGSISTVINDIKSKLLISMVK